MKGIGNLVFSVQSHIVLGPLSVVYPSEVLSLFSLLEELTELGRTSDHSVV